MNLQLRSIFDYHQAVIGSSHRDLMQDRVQKSCLSAPGSADYEDVLPQQDGCLDYLAMGETGDGRQKILAPLPLGCSAFLGAQDAIALVFCECENSQGTLANGKHWVAHDRLDQALKPSAPDRKLRFENGGVTSNLRTAHGRNSGEQTPGLGWGHSAEWLIAQSGLLHPETAICI